MASITIEQVTIPYEKELLLQWKQRDPKIVPQFLMDWNGPGISNGYGFDEWIAERFLEKKVTTYLLMISTCFRGVLNIRSTIL